MRKLKLGFVFGFSAAVIGCTSLLGDFDVSPAGSGPGPNGCQTGQSACGSTCVDLQTSATNCGACNRACPAGLSCTAGNCACPDNGAFCDGQCYPATDRQHCGATCVACQGNQVCQGGCVDPPAPAFDKPPRSATGWKDAANQPLTVTLKPTGQPGTIYECRTGLVASGFTDSAPAWGNCDGAAGDKPEHHPAAGPDGTYRTEYRYKLGAFTSPVIGTHYYVHSSLNSVATCPRQGVPVDGPHFSDEQYFAAATAFAIANVGAFPIASRFPDGGDKRDDAIYLGNPWIKIPFTNVHHTHGMDASNGVDDDPWPKEGGNYLFNERSLRHKWVLNGPRNMILVSRQYIHPKTNDCKNLIQVGNTTEPNYGPPGRGARKIDCEAYVLNTRGNAICLVPNGDKLAVLAVDTRIPLEDNLDGGTSLGAVFTTYATGKTVVATSGAPFQPSMVGGFLQIPESVYGRWFQIESVDPGGKFAYLTEATPSGGANQKVRFTPTAQSDQVVDTGFAKLHQDAHAWATGQKRVPAVTGPKISHPMPSVRTKCDTPGCNTGKPWLTYLPP